MKAVLSHCRGSYTSKKSYSKKLYTIDSVTLKSPKQHQEDCLNHKRLVELKGRVEKAFPDKKIHVADFAHIKKLDYLNFTSLASNIKAELDLNDVGIVLLFVKGKEGWNPLLFSKDYDYGYGYNRTNITMINPSSEKFQKQIREGFSEAFWKNECGEVKCTTKYQATYKSFTECMNDITAHFSDKETAVNFRFQNFVLENIEFMGNMAGSEL